MRRGGVSSASGTRRRRTSPRTACECRRRTFLATSHSTYAEPGRGSARPSTVVEREAVQRLRLASTSTGLVNLQHDERGLASTMLSVNTDPHRSLVGERSCSTLTASSWDRSHLRRQLTSCRCAGPPLYGIASSDCHRQDDAARPVGLLVSAPYTRDDGPAALLWTMDVGYCSSAGDRRNA